MRVIHRITHFPAAGKTFALREVFEDRIRAQQAKGYRCTLAQTIYGGDSLEIAISYAFDDLSGLEAFRRAVAPDQAALADRVAALASRSGRGEVFRVVVPQPPGGPVPTYTQRVVLYPVIGKLADLLAAIEKNTRERQASGIRQSVAQSLAGVPRLWVNFLAGSLEDLGNSPPLTAEQRKRTESLFGAPAEVYWQEVLIPFPAA